MLNRGGNEGNTQIVRGTPWTMGSRAESRATAPTEDLTRASANGIDLRVMAP
ncbi:hypothetical protein GCM10011487_22340 [Steroidobacter agaridevorans]|uniref:Uncharacterized protein n=1 Tax=Steroidobacter agaridevorans TaxID=2695856 RepID=A0A829YA63_9GAMM|nr:hypothetical protein GCM10011487_22340 [Steroidobacter agaridevorans]